MQMMTKKSPDQIDLQALQAKRREIARATHAHDLRLKHGAKVLEAISASLGISVSESDCLAEWQPAVKFVWNKPIENCPGLVASRLSRERALEIAKCTSQILGPCRACIGFDDKSYMGFISIKSLEVEKIVNLSELLEDSIFIYFDTHRSVVLIDYYEERWSQAPIDFNIVVQGEYLENLLKSCFELPEHP
jgi:hypothetical protein